MQLGRDPGLCALVHVACGQAVRDAALDTPNRFQATVARNIGRLARPGRYGPAAWHGQKQPTFHGHLAMCRTVIQQMLEDLHLLFAEFAADLYEMHEFRTQLRILSDQDGQTLQQFVQSKLGKGGRAAQYQHGNTKKRWKRMGTGE